MTPLPVICAAVEAVMGARLIQRRCRQVRCVRARWMAMWIARRRGHSYCAISRHLVCDHTTVMHGVARMTDLIESGEHEDDLRRVETELMDPRLRAISDLEAKHREITRQLQALKESS